MSDGGRFAVFSFVNDIRKLFNATIVFKVPPDEKQHVEALRQIWPEVDIRPFYSRNAIKNHAAKEKRNVLRKIVLPVIKFKHRQRAKRDAKRRAIRHQLYPFVPVERTFVDFLEQIFAQKKFDIVQTEYSNMLSLVHIIPATAKKVFFQHENRYAILQDYFNVHNDKSAYASYVVGTVKFTEMNLMNLYDRILVLNSSDEARLSEYIPAYKIQTMPTSVPETLIPKCTPSPKAARLVFMGSQNHQPNVDAVEWFAGEMLDKVLKQTGLPFYVTGKWKDSFRARYPKVKFTGFVDDIGSELEGGILVAPIRLGGGGIRIKILQAMACGIPVVATSLITDGITGIEQEKNIFIADTAAGFIKAISVLAGNDDIYSTVSKNAKELVETYYSEKNAFKIKEKIFYELLNN